MNSSEKRNKIMFIANNLFDNTQNIFQLLPIDLGIWPLSSLPF